MPTPYDKLEWLVIEKLVTLLSNEFPTSKIYKADLPKLHHYTDEGTFCIETVSADPMTEGVPHSRIAEICTFTIFIYLRYVDKEKGQEDIIDLKNHLEAFLDNNTNVRNDIWYDSNCGRTEFGIAVLGEGKTQTYLRMAAMSWSCKIYRQRQV